MFVKFMYICTPTSWGRISFIPALHWRDRYVGRWSGEGLGPGRGSGGGHLGADDGGDEDAGLDVKPVKHVLNPPPESKIQLRRPVQFDNFWNHGVYIKFGICRLDFFESKKLQSI